MSTLPFNHRLASGEASPHASQSTRPSLTAAYPAGVPRRLGYPTYPAWGLLERAAACVPHRIATRMFESELSFAETHQAATRLACWLQGQGLAAGDRVGILLPNMPEYLIALNGIWRAGGVAVALSPLSVPEELHALLNATQCRTVVCLDILSGLIADAPTLEMTLLTSLRDYLPSWKRLGYMAALWQRLGHVSLPNSPQQHWLWDAISEAAEGQVVPVEVLPSYDPAYILSTGGTTGNAKAVTLSHRNIVANAWQQSRWAGGTMGEESMLAVLPFFHSYGMSSMLTSGAALGATLTMQPRFDCRQALAAIARYRPTVLHAVPAMLSAMNERLRRKPSDLSSLKWVISGGAPLPVAIAEEFAQHSGALVVEGYGLSEASPVTHVGPLDATNRLGTIGLPLPDTDCRIVDSETGNQDLSPGEVGELLVRGPQVMLGYWNNPQATAQAIRDGWLHTGDLAMLTEEGFYRIVDRKKDLIITSGFNVYPADVEEVIRGCQGVADVAVIGVPDAERGERVKAYVVLESGQRWDEHRLVQYCKQHLAAHRRPREWEQVAGDLPRNFLGKVIRRELRESAASERQPGDAA